MRCPLYLHDRTPVFSGESVRKRQVGSAPRSPTPLLHQSLARFIPALREVVVNVDSRRPYQLNKNVVIVAFAVMTWADHGMWIQINPTNECSFIFSSSIDQPALLVLTEPWMGTVPTDLYA